MTPREKAEELVNEFAIVGLHSRMDGIQCALIAIDEIITFGNQTGIREPMMYWNKVKQEIEKL